MRWLWLLLFIPTVAAQAPTLTMDVSTGEFSIVEQAMFDVNGTLTCPTIDPDPDAGYTLSFHVNHYTSGGANVSGIQILLPDDIVLEAPCFMGGQQTWEGRFHVIDVNATPGAMYHIDVFVTATATGNLGQAAPDGTGVHTMGSAPAMDAPVVEAPVVPQQAPFGVWPLLLLVLLAFSRR